MARGWQYRKPSLASTPDLYLLCACVYAVCIRFIYGFPARLLGICFLVIVFFFSFLSFWSYFCFYDFVGALFTVQ